MKKVISLALVLLMFGAAALGSSDTDTKSVVSKASATDPKDSKATTAGGKKEETTTQATEPEIKFAVTDTKFEYYKNSIGSMEYHGIVEIQNTGSSYLYLENCTFDLEDDSGHLLQSDSFISSCPNVIAPGEKGYFYNGLTGTIDENVDLSNGIKLVPQYKVSIAKKGKDAIVEYQVSDTDLKGGKKKRPKVTGRITNNTDKDNSLLGVSIVFYDKEGKVLGIADTSVMDLDAGVTKSFDCDCYFLNDKVTADKIGEYKVIARDLYIQF